MKPNWYSSYTPKTAAGITAMSGGANLLTFVKYFRGTTYYTTSFDGDYLHGTATAVVAIGAEKLALAYTVASISAATICLY